MRYQSITGTNFLKQSSNNPQFKNNIDISNRLQTSSFLNKNRNIDKEVVKQLQSAQQEKRNMNTNISLTTRLASKNNFQNDIQRIQENRSKQNLTNPKYMNIDQLRITYKNFLKKEKNNQNLQNKFQALTQQLSEEELEDFNGRSLFQEIDYQNQKSARDEIQRQNLKQNKNASNKKQNLNQQKLNQIEDLTMQLLKSEGQYTNRTINSRYSTKRDIFTNNNLNNGNSMKKISQFTQDQRERNNLCNSIFSDLKNNNLQKFNNEKISMKPKFGDLKSQSTSQQFKLKRMKNESYNTYQEQQKREGSEDRESAEKRNDYLGINELNKKSVLETNRRQSREEIHLRENSAYQDNSFEQQSNEEFQFNSQLMTELKTNLGIQQQNNFINEKVIKLNDFDQDSTEEIFNRISNQNLRDYFSLPKVQKKKKYFPQISEEHSNFLQNKSKQNIPLDSNMIGIQVHLKGKAQREGNNQQNYYQNQSPYSGNWFKRKQNYHDQLVNNQIKKQNDQKQKVNFNQTQQFAIPGIRIPQSFSLTNAEKILESINILKQRGASMEQIEKVKQEEIQKDRMINKNNRSTFGELFKMQEYVGKKNSEEFEKLNQHSRNVMDRSTYTRKIKERETSDYNKNVLLKNDLKKHQLKFQQLQQKNFYLQNTESSQNSSEGLEILDLCAASRTINLNKLYPNLKQQRFITSNKEAFPEKNSFQQKQLHDFIQDKSINNKKKSAYQLWGEANSNNRVYFNPPVNSM